MVDKPLSAFLNQSHELKHIVLLNHEAKEKLSVLY